ncbi:hypothetical protein N7537_009859 [Penicillium hordei]|uniref:Uncharacterized protein n=1 Tax=Penicillium hordei TaxID=40994 RepID=A0AAD6DTK5_9EURO|nr:uncharacterized protein N7537_009859 [Penicillium hordei]KAJ5592955.1 hypothetical protein N7537_009859 [Penicillium hordei]
MVIQGILRHVGQFVDDTKLTGKEKLVRIHHPQIATKKSEISNPVRVALRNHAVCFFDGKEVGSIQCPVNFANRIRDFLH